MAILQRECEKDKQPASGFTKPSTSRPSSNNNGTQARSNTQERPNTQGNTSSALVSTSDENYDWSAQVEEIVAYDQA